jgi:hypothetical protein
MSTRTFPLRALSALYATFGVMAPLLLASVSASADPLPSGAASPADEAPSPAGELLAANADAARGDLAAARARAAHRATHGATLGERAAGLELLYVVDAWRAAGGPPPSVRTPARAPAGEWEARFEASRDLLVRGSYAQSKQAFEELLEDAPDVTATLRAVELRDLAAEALAHAEAPPAHAEAPPPLPAPAPRPATPPSPASRASPETSPSGAGDRASRAGDGAATRSRWYGWQTLIVDGSALAVAFVRPELTPAVYVFGGPIVHAAHGRWGTGLLSLGLRVGAPLVGGLAGAAVTGGAGCVSSSSSSCISLGLVGGLLVGYATAVTVDAAVLAREPAAREDARRAPRRAAALSWAPSVAPRRDGAELGVSGAF